MTPANNYADDADNAWFQHVKTVENMGMNGTL